jgi:hypothetical protein
MQQRFQATNDVTPEGNPDGGSVQGTGIQIRWQRGPIGRGEERQEPNGAFVEDVIAIAKQRIEHYQESRFACDENALAIAHLDAALLVLHERTAKREERGVEGTWGV